MNIVNTSFIKWAALVACAAFTVGCASGPPRELEAQLVGTDTSIAQAEQSGAAVGALPELQGAKDKRARAQEAFDKKDWDLSLRLAKQAQADATYAAKKAQADQAHKAALEVDRGTEKLRSETERNLEKAKTE
jgi:hypothetical protein